MTEEVSALVRSLRPMLLPYWGNVEAKRKVSSSGSYSAVTDIDREVEQFLQTELARIDSTVTFAGEEFGGSRDAERFWLCDPIDGTMQFIRGLPNCSVMLALIEKGVVNFSLIYDFLNDDLYRAERGKGAFKNDERLHVSKRPLSDAYLALEARLDTDEAIALRKRLRASAKLFTPGVSGYTFTLVARGKLEGHVCINGWGRDYDFAPGALLVEEAGGVVRNFGSETYDFKNVNFIAANPAVYEALTGGSDPILPNS